ncbi:MAG: bifunctional sulfate adenylyltransferase subunit 1/adenylylsulfate kinase [Mycobacteriaceae bacterium]|nr:bifunctional sulfate adenylyltransferase subunit 1/adenylylsulfate kinase [Mycobacteriaceae bacterium]
MSTLLRIATAGSVDDGKSTLIGRLLFDSKVLMQDQLAAVEQTSKARGDDFTDLSLLTDGLRAEREQGITIDVAYRYFATPRRKFIIADTPGHVQYTRNMVTGTSTAQLAVVLVDARHGLMEQSRRHAFLASLLGVRHLVLAVNKMDLVGWDAGRFGAIKDEFHDFAARLGVHDVMTIPMSALHGDNVVVPSPHTPWYHGPTLLTHLEEVFIAGDRNLIDMRFPVQYVIRPQARDHPDHRSYGGTVLSGVLRPGDEVVVLPSGKTTRIQAIDGPSGPVPEAFPPMAVSVELADDVDVSRGDLIARTANRPRVCRRFDAVVCWMADEQHLAAGRQYLVKHTTKTTRAEVESLAYRLDVNTLHRDRTATALRLNELGRVALRTREPLLVDEYTRIPGTGSFILIDPDTNGTVAAGMVLPSMRPGESDASDTSGAARRSASGATVWCVGAPATPPQALAADLLGESGRPAFILDEAALDDGLNADLGTSAADGEERHRRLAHIARFLAESGQAVIVSARTASPLARRIHEDAGVTFLEFPPPVS